MLHRFVRTASLLAAALAAVAPVLLAQEHPHLPAADGKSHLMDFTVNGVAAGTGDSEIRLAAPGRVAVTVTAAARLEETPVEAVRRARYDEKPYWDLGAPASATAATCRSTSSSTAWSSRPATSRPTASCGR